MRSHRAMFVAGAVFVAACSSAPPKDTLATLHKVAPDLQDVKVEGGPATLRHQEHAPIALGDGTYRVRRQRELEPKDAVIVAD